MFLRNPPRRSFLGDFPTLDTSSIEMPSTPVTDIPGFSFGSDLVNPVSLPELPLTTVQMPDIQTLPLTTVQMPSIPELPLTTVQMPDIQTLPQVTVQMPATTQVAPQAPQPSSSTNVAQQAGTGSNADWFTSLLTNVVKPIATAGLQTWQAVEQYNTAKKMQTLPAGVSSQYLTAQRGPLTAAQVAALTPAQQQAYYSQYPYSNPSLYGGYGGVSTGPTDIASALGLSSLGLSTPTLIMLAGSAILFFMFMNKSPSASSAAPRTRTVTRTKTRTKYITRRAPRKRRGK